MLSIELQSSLTDPLQCLCAFEKYRMAVLFSRKMKDQRMLFDKKVENLERLLQVILQAKYIT